MSIPGDFWPGLLDTLKGQVPMGEYMFLKKTQGRVEEGVLNLYVDSDFTRSMLNKPTVMEPLNAAADAILDAKHRVALVVGQAPAAKAAPKVVPAPAPEPEMAPESRSDAPLDDLLAFGEQFDNIVIQ